VLAGLRRTGGVHTTSAAERGYLEDDPEDPARKLIRQVPGAVSGYERNMIRLRLEGGRRAKAEQGRYAGYGSPAFGQHSGGGELVAGEREQAVLARMARLRGGGLSYDRIAGQLNAGGPGRQARRAVARAGRRPRAEQEGTVMTRARQLTVQALAGLHAKNVIWAFTRDVARAAHRPAGGPDGVRRALDTLVRAGLVKCGQAGTGDRSDVAAHPGRAGPGGPGPGGTAMISVAQQAYVSSPPPAQRTGDVPARSYSPVRRKSQTAFPVPCPGGPPGARREKGCGPANPRIACRFTVRIAVGTWRSRAGKSPVPAATGPGRSPGRPGPGR